MLYSALIILTVGLIAPALALVGVAAAAGKMAWMLFFIGILLLGILLITERSIPKL